VLGSTEETACRVVARGRDAAPDAVATTSRRSDGASNATVRLFYVHYQTAHPMPGSPEAVRGRNGPLTARGWVTSPRVRWAWEVAELPTIRSSWPGQRGPVGATHGRVARIRRAG